MFKDSEIAKGIQLGRDKMAYFLIFGIAPFFKENFMKELLLCEHLVIGFDESLNKISQMDLNVRFWCLATNEVKTQYLNSAFLGRSCSEDLLAAFKEATKPLNLKKLSQVSMDGPNANFKFFKELTSCIKEGPEDPEILNMGSCGLHSVNLAFKTGAKCTNWKIFDFMRALYYVFKNSPARRALYTLYTNSKDFPKKFCAIRWLENSQVAERCLDILPHIKVFIEQVEKDKNAPTSKSYVTIKEHISDPLLPAKLAFFQSIANEFESFLTEYQTNVPLIPFLFEDLTNLVSRLLKRFVLRDALKEGNILNVDFENVASFLPSKKIDVGISALCHIKKAKASEGQLNTFFKDARKFLIGCVRKLLERSPLIYILTRSVSCFNPMVTLSETLFDQRLTKLLLILCENNWMTPISTDKAKNQLKEVCAESKNVSKLKMYKRTERVDKFWFDLLSTYPKPCNDAISLLKMIMILSHGNSNVERGFSINKECLWENMKEQTLIARRIVYDSIQANGGINNFEVSKQLILSVRNSRGNYEEYKEKKLKEEKELRENLKRKREAENQLKELKAKKLKILEAAQKDSLRVEEEIASLKLLQKKL
ncbi:hypothetical protein AVEN_212602-1 [Araneus ventricosus]|uniref:HAT C-terminal dimerisation domain-containing protein n=1 Tax=Araneus ventricosus TaxID=182803 RepID=A0A4Y2VZD2_ARAVE|nr:hypothetical protein AVEN_212602-1 [Araneus ventricosus]